MSLRWSTSIAALAAAFSIIFSAPRATATAVAAIQPASAMGSFDVQTVADGVVALIRKEPAGLMVDANSVFIINDDDVVVVDTNVAPSSARASLAALRKLTSKPVRYVVNTHWHDDHVLGNEVYREAFPAAEFIGHENLREYLPAQGAVNRKNMLASVPQGAEMLRNAVKDGKSLVGGAMTDAERPAYLSDIAMADRYLAEVPGVSIVLPTVTVHDQLTLYRGRRTIEIRYLGRGHTHGDIVVNLPQEHVVITGDLVVAPVPLIGADQSFVGDWSGTLEKLRALHATTYIPGHGPVMHDDTYVQLFARMLASAKQQTDAAIARGETIDQARKSVNLDEFRKAMAGDDRELNLLFSNYAQGPAIGAVYREKK